MIAAELPLIVDALRGCNAPIVDVGSSTAAFRARAKLPYDLAQLIGQPIVCFDLQAAPGVDVVGDAERLLDHFRPRSVGGIICTSLLEHTRRPWVIVRQIARAMRDDGRAIITVPWVYPEHQDPLDCWRISPDGLCSLAADAGLLQLRAGLLSAGPARITYFVGGPRT